jgi:hypothetical protein
MLLMLFLCGMYWLVCVTMRQDEGCVQFQLILDDFRGKCRLGRNSPKCEEGG